MSRKAERDAEATKRRLLDVAAQEFAQYGIAGARVDRIASAAQSNKAQIYYYFTSKTGLMNAVLSEVVAFFLQEVPFDATDLPAYAGRLFDQYEAHPQIMRLLSWYRLEQPEAGELNAALMAANRQKLAALAEAQAAGQVTSIYPAEILLLFITQLSVTWTPATQEHLELTRSIDQAQRRENLTAAVRRLVTP